MTRASDPLYARLSSIRSGLLVAAPLLVGLLLVTACHRPDPAAETTSPADAEALNDAAAMLDANSVDPGDEADDNRDEAATPAAASTAGTKHR